MFLHLHCLNIFALVCLCCHFNIVIGQERKIKSGDAIEIVVYGQEQMSQTVVVKSNGRVNYPFLEGVPIEGITLQRLQEILMAQLSRVIKRSLVVAVDFAESYPIKVTVLGQVASPGIYVIPNTANLQVALAQAGGPIPGAQLSQVKLIRKNEHEINNQVVNLESFYIEGEPNYLPQLEDDDIIMVPGFSLAKTVKVLGSVERPGSYELPFPASLLDVIFLAGGPTDQAKLSAIKVTSNNGDKPYERHFNLDAILKKENKNIPIIKPGDVVYVPEKAITWKKFIAFARDITIFVTLYVIIQRDR
ncbi:MAG: hypothetical protein GWN00_29135 [Aliifodinibius sp.]|nr:hypothetical protein [Fodinibius sp.]NIV14836.1 hypothetical protein [Fodinibius sp.]NIY28715.1 hypothetical protein [Fodinibius sp.]